MPPMPSILKTPTGFGMYRRSLSGGSANNLHQQSAGRVRRPGRSNARRASSFAPGPGGLNPMTPWAAPHDLASIARAVDVLALCLRDDQDIRDLIEQRGLLDALRLG